MISECSERFKMISERSKRFKEGSEIIKEVYCTA